MLYGIEFLIAWLLLKDVLFSASSVHFLSNWGIRLVCLLLMATHVAVFEPRQSPSSVDEDDSTVLMDAEEEASETRMDDEHTANDASSSPTEDLPLIYFGNMRERISSQLREQRRSTESSPYFVNLRKEATRIGIAFEIFMITVAACVLRNGMPMAWTRPFTAWLVLLATVGLWILVGVLVFMKARSGRSSTSTFMPFSKKYQYTSIDV
jgi:hypothetical protein